MKKYEINKIKQMTISLMKKISCLHDVTSLKFIKSMQILKENVKKNIFLVINSNLFLSNLNYY